MRGTIAVAAIHAVVIAFTSGSGCRWSPLVVLVFLASFIPLVGILVVGALAVP